MPRRHVREYDEEDLYDDDDREPLPPPRPRRSRRHEPDMRYNMRAPSPPTPMEEFERLDLRDRPEPEFLPEDFEPPPRERRPLPIRREHNGIGMPPRELVRNFERARGEARRHGHPHRRVFIDEDYGSPEEPESGPEPERRYMESDSEGELAPMPRKERSLPRHRREIKEELLPRSSSQKEARKVRRSRVERDDIHPTPVDIRDEIRGPRGHHHHHRASRSHPVSGYQTEVYESADDVPEEEVVMKKARRRRDLGRDRERLEEDEVYIQDRDLSSSEVDDPRMPPSVRMPPHHRNFDDEHLHIHEGKEFISCASWLGMLIYD